MPNSYTITGATGNIGRVIAEMLLAQGHRVRAVARTAETLQAVADKGADVYAGNMNDVDFLTAAYEGVDAVFAMIPPNMQSNDYLAYADKIGAAHVTAIQKAGVKNVVALSSIGAHLKEGSGIVRALYDFEQRLKTIENVDVLVLRPSYFMDNVYMQADVIRHLGFVGSPVAAEISQPVVATHDIAEFAAKRLSALDLGGFSVEYVLGERNLSYAEITRVLGQALKKSDLQYVQFPYKEAAMAMVQMGISENVTGLLVGLAEGINDGKVLEHYKRTPENTTGTSIEQFAEGFARML